MLHDATNAFIGMQITTDINMVEDGTPYHVRRTWRERLLSRPWQPFRATRTVVPKVPSRQILHFGNRLVMHPAMLEEVRRVAHSQVRA